MESGQSQIDASAMPSSMGKKNKNIVKRFSKKLVKVFTSSKKKKAQKLANEEAVKIEAEATSMTSAGGESHVLAEITTTTMTMTTTPRRQEEEEKKVDDPLEECAFWARDTVDMKPKLAEQEEISSRRREMLDTMFAGKSSDDTAEEFHPERFLLEKLHSASAADLKLFLQFLELSEGALDEETLNKLVEVVDALCILNTQIEDKVAEDEWPVSKGLEGKIEWIKYNVNLNFREQLDARTAAAIAAERVGSKPTGAFDGVNGGQ